LPEISYQKADLEQELAGIGKFHCCHVLSTLAVCTQCNLQLVIIVPHHPTLCAHLIPKPLVSSTWTSLKEGYYKKSKIGMIKEISSIQECGTSSHPL
jgi:hypothetical protein